MNEIKILNADAPFEVEITGIDVSRTAVIFVHGFGVKRDSRGMFIELEKKLAATYLCVRSEFSSVLEDRCVALPFSIQQQRLLAITEYMKEQYGSESFIYIGHSQGAITIGLEQPQNSQILLLAPPVLSPFSEFIKTSGWKKNGSFLDIKGLSRLVRSDLMIDVPPDFWAEFKLINAEELYSQLSINNELFIIFAGSDQVLGEQQPPNNVKTYTIPNADHDFSAKGRKPLVEIIQSLT